MYGVSPAFVLSRYGEGFTPHDYKSSLALIRALGFDAFQGEVYRSAELSVWIESGSAVLAEEAKRVGLFASQFVAHFLLEAFEDERVIASEYGYDPFGRFCEMVRRDWPEVKFVTIPLPPLARRVSAFSDLVEAYTARLERFAEIACDRGLDLAVELLPGGLFTGAGHLAAYLDRRNSRFKIGFTFDSGHAMACKERVDLVPHRVPVWGTHLCDNDGEENRSLVPGDGAIDWRSTFNALRESEYAGSYDLEILCPSDEIEREYARGLTAVRAFRESSREYMEVVQ